MVTFLENRHKPCDSKLYQTKPKHNQTNQYTMKLSCTKSFDNFVNFLVFDNFGIIYNFGNFEVILSNLTVLYNFTILGQFEL